MFSAVALLSHVTGPAAAVSIPLAEMAGSAISISWGLVMFCIILGMMVTLAPSRRTTEIKRTKDE